jgi:hypothetical protein
VGLKAAAPAELDWRVTDAGVRANFFDHGDGASQGVDALA